MADLAAPLIETEDFSLEYDRTWSGEIVSTAVAELVTGVTIRLRIADHIALVNELPNVDRSVVVLAYPTTGTELRSGSSPGVAEPEVWEAPWCAELSGTVTEVHVEPVPQTSTAGFHVLDVGVGDLYVHPSVEAYLDDSDLPLEPGDELRVVASLLELWDVSP